MKNKYVINGRFLSRKITGVDRFAFELINELDKIVNPGEFELAVPINSITSIPKYQNIKGVKVGHNKGNIWEQIDLCFYALKQNRKTINLCNAAPLLKPDIVAIFDTKINDHPEFYSKMFVLWYKLQFFNTINKSSLILTDSFSAKKDIIRNYPYVNINKIQVIYPSWQHMQRVKNDDNILSKYGLVDNGYFFSLSSLEPNKNLKWIIDAANHNFGKMFVIAGKTEGIYNKEKYKILTNNVRFIGYVNDEESKTLMKHCEAFIFPSFEEGFGLPPLESVCAGCNSLIVSDIPVMHELFCDFVSYIDPRRYRNGDLEIKHIDNSIREKVLSRFSWKDSAEKLYKLLK